jgi:hypothetical protein
MSPTIRLLALSALVCAVCAPADAAAPAGRRTAMEVARNLDVTSFPNSIGPRRERGKKRFVDYGVTRFTRTPDGVAVEEPDHSWLFEISILTDRGVRKVICFEDKNTGGGSYHTVDAMEVKRGRDGLYRATGRHPVDRRCPQYPEGER